MDANCDGHPNENANFHAGCGGNGNGNGKGKGKDNEGDVIDEVNEGDELVIDENNEGDELIIDINEGDELIDEVKEVDELIVDINEGGEPIDVIDVIDFGDKDVDEIDQGDDLIIDVNEGDEVEEVVEDEVMDKDKVVEDEVMDKDEVVNSPDEDEEVDLPDEDESSKSEEENLSSNKEEEKCNLFGFYLLKMVATGEKQVDRAEGFVEKIVSSYAGIFNADRRNPDATSDISVDEMIKILNSAMEQDKDFIALDAQVRIPFIRIPVACPEEQELYDQLKAMKVGLQSVTDLSNYLLNPTYPIRQDIMGYFNCDNAIFET